MSSFFRHRHRLFFLETDISLSASQSSTISLRSFGMVEQRGKQSRYRRMQHSHNLHRKSSDFHPHLLLVARPVPQVSTATTPRRVNPHLIRKLSNSLPRSVRLVHRYFQRRNRSTSLLSHRSPLDHYLSELYLNGTVETLRTLPTRRPNLPLSRQSSSVQHRARRLELRASPNFLPSPQTMVERRLIYLDSCLVEEEARTRS